MAGPGGRRSCTAGASDRERSARDQLAPGDLRQDQHHGPCPGEDADGKDDEGDRDDDLRSPADREARRVHRPEREGHERERQREHGDPIATPDERLERCAVPGRAGQGHIRSMHPTHLRLPGDRTPRGSAGGRADGPDVVTRVPGGRRRSPPSVFRRTDEPSIERGLCRCPFHPMVRPSAEASSSRPFIRPVERGPRARAARGGEGGAGRRGRGRGRRPGYRPFAYPVAVSLSQSEPALPFWMWSIM